MDTNQLYLNIGTEIETRPLGLLDLPTDEPLE